MHYLQDLIVNPLYSMIIIKDGNEDANESDEHRTWTVMNSGLQSWHLDSLFIEPVYDDNQKATISHEHKMEITSKHFEIKREFSMDYFLLQ